MVEGLVSGWPVSAINGKDYFALDNRSACNLFPQNRDVPIIQKAWSAHCPNLSSSNVTSDVQEHRIGMIVVMQAMQEAAGRSTNPSSDIRENKTGLHFPAPW